MCTGVPSPGGSLPSHQSLAVRSQMASVTGKMGRMSALDIHEERLETLRKQAVDRLRGRRAYHCPGCGYRSFQRECSRCGEACEAASRPPS